MFKKKNSLDSRVQSPVQLLDYATKYIPADTCLFIRESNINCS